MRRSVRSLGRPSTPRPFGVAVLSTTGVLFGLAVALATLGVVSASMLAGGASTGLLIGALVVLLMALTVIWFYWGLWEMLGSAWWSHMFLGPLAVIGLALLLVGLPDVVGPIAGGMHADLRTVSEQILKGGAVVLIGIEGLAVGYLLTVRRAFGIGVPKKAWER